MAESEEELKSLLMRVNEGSKKPGLKLNIQKTKIMASGSITSQQIEREKVEIVTDFILGAPKSLWTVTAAMKLKDACSWKKKTMTNLDSMLKSRDIPLSTKACMVKAMVFGGAVMYWCERWTRKKGEH